MKRGGKPARLQHRWKRKVFVLVLLGLCLLTMLLMRSQYSMIVKLASLSTGRPKIASLFIARNRLPLDLVWHAFFKGEEDRFSIHVHSRPRFLFNKATTRSAYFLNRQVIDSVQVEWGETSMIEAERILLRHALEDPLNEHFLFLSYRILTTYIMRQKTGENGAAVVDGHRTAFCLQESSRGLPTYGFSTRRH